MADKKRSNTKKINNAMKVILLVTMICVVGCLGWNIYKITSLDTGETIDTEKKDNKFKNDQYAIGNNPTEINKQYFTELTDAVKDTSATDATIIPQDVVKCFITEYYTWTNKDGNYDIGGMQYIYQPKQKDFEEYTLYNYYKDMDLYLNQYGRDALMQVKNVTINSAAQAEDMTVQTTVTDANADSQAAAETTVLPSVNVDASWTYEINEKLQMDDFQTHAIFRLVNNNGRWEIAEIAADAGNTEGI